MSFSFKPVVSEQTTEFAPIAPGEYQVQFAELEEKPTQSGGVQWSAKMKIPATNRTFFLSWNVENASEVAQRIAREQISQIASLLGVQDDISIESIKTNKLFTVVLEQRPYNDKVYYQTKGPWKLADILNVSAVKKVQDKLALPVAEKKKNPWDVR